ncbi:MAG: hypothetical protein CMO80_12910 [Verrucomicrobiales bacterium]|nr:hypothetical protein [Verrucomicrobiales bacterium]
MKQNSILTRREFLERNALGMGSVALAWLLQQERLRANPAKPELERPSFDTLPKQTHHDPSAKAMISIFMQGGPSHMDICDPKPALDKYAGKDFPGKIKYDNAAQASPKVLPSFWKFHKYGQSGMDFSDLVPGFSSIADEITLIRSMHTGVNNHGQSIHAMNTGRTTRGRPALGSWLTYGLGSFNQNLPAYMVLRDPSNLPVEGVLNWSSGWLPSLYQGTVVRARDPRILNLEPPAELRGKPQENYLGFLDDLNRRHANLHPGELDLEARIASFELAARMQAAAAEAMDISNESETTKKLYGIDKNETKDFGTRCLIARRLVERGVRFVQVFTRNQFWDHHGSIRSSLPASCTKIDQPTAALIKDLKTLGLLDSTVVHWGGEMGRLPVIQNDTGISRVGRDHNTYGFSMWVAGGGFKKGYIHGATDEFGHKAIDKVVNHYDYHATLMHLFGLNAERLTYFRNRQEQTILDGQPGKVVTDLLA